MQVHRTLPASRSSRFVLCIAAALCAAVVFTALQEWLICHRAGELLGDLRVLAETRTPDRDFASFQQKYAADIAADNGVCPVRCQYRIKYDNYRVSRTRLFPFTSAAVWLTVNAGHLEWFMIEFRQEHMDGGRPVVHAQVRLTRDDGAS